jgi:retinal rod rhodopsin-sensitive cGMP 3',5'-cyclic phosphodiesterase subunit delta
VAFECMFFIDATESPCGIIDIFPPNSVSMSMRDADNGRLIWRSADWDPEVMFQKEIAEEIPKDILKCRVVSREITFSSEEAMTDFRLEQRVYFKGTCIEEWFFKFGYVMSGSRNSWQQTIDAAPPSEMLPAEVLSGEVVFETNFFDGEVRYSFLFFAGCYSVFVQLTLNDVSFCYRSFCVKIQFAFIMCKHGYYRRPFQ